MTRHSCRGRGAPSVSSWLGFFFSSRRRHTRLQGDWSSDVCSSDLVSAWFKRHPSIEVVSRDRSSEFAAAASQGAPQAVQVADRWHVGKNLAETLSRSEEHTSELQSPCNLVCRLLLEKKKNNKRDCV